MGYVRGVNAISSADADAAVTAPGRVVLLTTSHRVAPCARGQVVCLVPVAVTSRTHGVFASTRATFCASQSP